MDIEIKKGIYKDIECITMENSYNRIVVIPKSGGKIQSIYDKEEKHEHLYQSPNTKFSIPIYGNRFESCDFSGFDDMFPNILTCYYPDYPWNGIELPDHGEVWTQPFDCITSRDSIVLTCSGVRLPYIFEKKITMSHHQVKISYHVKNNSNYTFKYIWAAHALKKITKDSEVLLPNGIDKIFYTFGGLNSENIYGEIKEWDKTYGRMPDPGLCKKYYVYGELPKGECALYNNRTYHYLKLIFPVEKVPYLGVWINNDGYYGQKNVAIEPCTGAFDVIDIADKYGWISKLRPKQEVSWYLIIEIGKNKNKNSVL